MTKKCIYSPNDSTMQYIHTFYFTTLEMLLGKTKWVLNDIELQHSTNCVQPNLVCNIKTTNKKMAQMAKSAIGQNFSADRESKIIILRMG